MRRTFSHTARAWYNDVNDSSRIRDSIDIEVTTTDVETQQDIKAEFGFEFFLFENEKRLSPCLTVLSDGWYVLIYYCEDLLEALAERTGEDIQPLEMCKLLEELGFEDVTPTAQPQETLQID